MQSLRKTSTASSTTSAKTRKSVVLGGNLLIVATSNCNFHSDDGEKLARLQQSTRAFEAMMIVMSRTNEESERKLAEISEQYGEKIGRFDGSILV